MELIEGGWVYLRSFLPDKEEIERTAREMGVLERRRVIRSGEDLLRLILVYAVGIGGLRSVASWAKMMGIADISDVGILKRFKKASRWMGKILAMKLREYTEVSKKDMGKMRVLLVDATTISERGSRGTDWRVHVGYDLGSQSIVQVEVTDVKGGETLKRFRVGPGEVVIGDRAYASRQGLKSVIEGGGDFLVRLNWSTVPLQTLEGKEFDLIGALRKLKDTEIGDFDVQTKPDKRKGLPAIKGRLIAIRKTPQAAEAARAEVKRIYKRKRGRSPDPRTLETAEYVFLFTSLDRERASAEALLELYRFRWQIELLFKRLKGLLNLSQLPPKDPLLIQTYLYAKLLLAILLQEISTAFLFFSPWGFRFP